MHELFIVDEILRGFLCFFFCRTKTVTAENIGRWICSIFQKILIISIVCKVFLLFYTSFVSLVATCLMQIIIEVERSTGWISLWMSSQRSKERRRCFPMNTIRYPSRIVNTIKILTVKLLTVSFCAHSCDHILHFVSKWSIYE